MKQRHWTMLVLSLLALALILYKTLVLHITPAAIVPQKQYSVTLKMSMEGHDRPVMIRSLLPLQSDRQQISNEKLENGTFAFREGTEDGNRAGLWSAQRLGERQTVKYSFTVLSKRQQFSIPNTLPKPTITADDSSNLSATKLIQVNHPTIVSLARHLKIDTMTNCVEIVKTVYAYTSDTIVSAKFSGETDAITANALKQASCNGKSRLAVALLRQVNIPSRLVGGIILTNGKKRTSHQWVEVRMGDQWVPFCPLNHHLFETPENYLVIYHGDESLLRRTGNTGFDYKFDIESEMVQRTAAIEGPAKFLNLLYVWEHYSKASMPLELFRTILMIPIGALIIIVFRNVIGIRTFGVFLPVLIATAFRETGLFWGQISFLLIFSVGLAVRKFLSPFELMHTPKLTIILVFVIVTMISLGIVGPAVGIPALANATLFPIAIMTLTAERFFITYEEGSLGKAIMTLFNSMVVISFCYFAMLSLFLQMVVLTYPEVLLLVITVSLYLGSWTELRLMEIYRFRHILFKKDQPVPEIQEI